MNSSQSLTYNITFFTMVFSFLFMHRISFTSQWTRPTEQWACEALVWSLLFFFFADRLNMYSDSTRSLLSCIQYFWSIFFSSSPNKCPVSCPISALLLFFFFFFLLLLSYHYAREQYRYFILNKMLIYVVVVECIPALFGTTEYPRELTEHSWHFWYRCSWWVNSDDGNRLKLKGFLCQEFDLRVHEKMLDPTHSCNIRNITARSCRRHSPSESLARWIMQSSGENCRDVSAFLLLATRLSTTLRLE